MEDNNSTDFEKLPLSKSVEFLFQEGRIALPGVEVLCLKICIVIS